MILEIKQRKPSSGPVSPRSLDVFLNGKKVPYLKKFSLSFSDNSFPVVQIEFFPSGVSVEGVDSFSSLDDKNDSVA